MKQYRAKLVRDWHESAGTHGRQLLPPANQRQAAQRQ